jgi:ubiquinol-cytochrome c reductase cytochrome b subunit
VLLVPALILGLVAAHMLLVVYHKHTQWAGPGRTEENVVGYPMMPVYAAKAGGFFFIVFGVTALMGGLLSINPVWKYGPYDPSKVTAGSQPDWYMGIAEGLLRIMPHWETHIIGTTWSWNVFLPGEVAPMVLLGIMMAWPFLEAWVTGDKSEHHILDRPRNAPTRTAFLAAMMSIYGLLWAAGGNDLLATQFSLNMEWITRFMRVAIFVVPVLVFFIAKRWCIALQRHDSEKLLHGYETGIIMRSPEGAYSERHLPITNDEAYRLTARARDHVIEAPVNGEVEGKGARAAKLRSKLSTWMFADNVQKPTAQELEEAHHHADHEHELEAGLDHAADGHQFDGRHEVEGDTLRH